jgi:hypothetical protein
VKTVTAVLEYEGQRYTVSQDSWDEAGYDDAEDLRHGVHYMWTEGNWSCDCNRFDFISYAYDDYPGKEDENGGFPCGDTVTLVSLRIEGDPVCIMCNGTGLEVDLRYDPTLRVTFRADFACPHCNGTGSVTSASHVTAAPDRAASENPHEMGEIGSKSAPLVPQG